ncbi:MAG TPA: helix-turn-helix transcriptional regulator [Candidatus Dormibacteraeota bacterium]
MPLISPIGRTVEEDIREALTNEPEFRGEYERIQPYYDAAFEVAMLRARHNLTQEELARRIGTTKSAISRLESGRHKPNVDTLNRVARAFGKRLVIRFEDAEELTGGVGAAAEPHSGAMAAQ